MPIELDAIRTTVELEDQVSKGLVAISDHFSAVTKAVDALSKEMAQSDAAFKKTVNGLAGIEDAGKKTGKSLFDIDALFGKIGLANLTPAGAALTGVGIAATAVVAVVTAVAAGIAYVTNKAADLGDELFTLHNKTDLSVETLSELRFVANQTGVEFGTISSSVSILQKSLGQGGEKVENAISKLHLSLADLRNSKPEDAFKQIIEALKDVPNSMDRAALGAAIFRGKFRELNALTKEDLGEISKEFHDFGGTVTTEMAVAGDAFNDVKGKIGFIFESLQVQLGNVFLPAATGVLNAFVQAFTDTRKSVGVDSTKFSDYIDKTAEAFIAAMGLMIQSTGHITKALADFFLGKDIGSFKLIEILAKAGNGILAVLEAYEKLTATVTRTQGGVEFVQATRAALQDLEKLSASAKTGFNDVRIGINTAADVAITFGENLTKNAAGSVKKVRDEIEAAAAAARNSQGDFEGLGERVAKVSKEQKDAAAAFKKVVDDKSFLTLIDKFEKEQVKMAESSTKAISKMWSDTKNDREDAADIMRRITMSETAYEIDNVKRRLKARMDELATIKSLGIDVSNQVGAANEKANAEIFKIVINTKEFNNTLAATLSVMGPLTGAFDVAVNHLNDLGEGFDDGSEKAKEFKQDVVDIMNDVGDAIRNVIKDGGGLADIFEGVAGVLSKRLTSTLTSTISKGVADGTTSGVAAFAGTIATIGLSYAIDYALKKWKENRMSAAAREAGAAAASQFASGFGGEIAARRFAQLAGIDSIDMSHVLSPSSPEMFQRWLAKLQPQIDAFQNALKGLGVAAQGANTLVQGFVMNYSKTIETQTKALEAVQKAHLDAMKAGGASTEQIAADSDAFTEGMKTHTFESTQAQIDAFNRAGTIIGGVIANTVNKTGDLVGAVMAVGDALQGLSDFKTKFGLGDDQIGAATAQVLALYSAIKDNEDVFTSISGIGQVMTGLGDALVHNSTLANAFGGELAADFQTLVDRGVDVNTIWASMAPQLQQLWELQKDGRITVDATTKALLDQAEAAGIVGDTQRDINEQILMVLTDIRDLIGFVGNVALPRMGTAADAAGHAVQRSFNGIASAGVSAGNAVRDVQNGLNGIKSPPPIDIHVRAKWEEGDVPDWANGEKWTPNPTQDSGGTPTWDDAPSFRRGSGGFQDFGDGTLAMLHGRERVQTEADYTRDNSSSTILVEVDGEAIVAANVRNQSRYTRIRTGSSPRTIR